jgi:hypothetical protein
MPARTPMPARVLGPAQAQAQSTVLVQTLG